MVTVVGYAYPWDVCGAPEFLSDLHRLGVTRVALAAYYHGVRAATPRHPLHRFVTTPRSLVAAWRVRRGSRTADCRGVHGFRVARTDPRGWAAREPSTPSADRVWRSTRLRALPHCTRGSGLCRSPRTPVDAIGRIRLSSGVCRISRIRSRIPS